MLNMLNDAKTLLICYCVDIVAQLPCTAESHLLGWPSPGPSCSAIRPSSDRGRTPSAPSRGGQRNHFPHLIDIQSHSGETPMNALTLLILFIPEVIRGKFLGFS